VTRRSDALPWIALAAVYLFWGSTYLGIRVAVETLPPYLMTGTRWLLAGALLVAWQWLTSAKKPRLPSRTEVVHIVVTAVLLLVLGNGLLCVAETHVESGTSALLVASTPIWMLLIDALLAAKTPPLTAIGGVVLGSAGIVLLVGRGAGNADLFFSFIIMVASVAWAVGSIYARGKEHRPLTAALEMLAGGALCIIVGLVSGEASRLKLEAVSAASIWGMVWLITGGAMVGYSAYAYAVRTLPVATVATYAYVTPVVAVVLGALILREPVTWNVAAGGAAIVVAVVLILIGNRRAAQELTSA
jgi:drug/metabolite transporter (DMT)-like permease